MGPSAQRSQEECLMDSIVGPEALTGTTNKSPSTWTIGQGKGNSWDG